jgi:hypothetical protein
MTPSQSIEHVSLEFIWRKGDNEESEKYVLTKLL